MATAAIGIGASLLNGLGGLFGKNKSTTDSRYNSETDQQQRQVGSQQNTYDYDPSQLALRDTLLNQFLGRATNGDFDVNGIINSQMSNINQASAARTNAIMSMLASRGLLRSPIGANALINEQGYRVGQGVGVMNQAPTLRESILQSRLNDASSFLRSLPVNTSSHFDNYGYGSQQSSGQQHSETIGTGSGPANLFSGLGNTLAYGAGQGWFGGKK